MKVPMPLASALVVALMGCGSPSPQAHSQASQSTATQASPTPTAVTATAMPATVAMPSSQEKPMSTECMSTSAPPVPSPTAASDAAGAPRTTVFIVGTVCSAATGQPLAGARVGAELLEQFCAEGHQPWRCGSAAVSDSTGHYGVAFYNPDSYRLTIEHDGYRASGGVVQATRPGIVTVNWSLVPVA
jgi:uncharacterized protein involved in copper resistance